MQQNNMQNFAINMLSRNPNVANNPNAKAMLDVIRSGNSAQGEQIANNLCKSMGLSREEALKQARSFFRI